jgi:hypothetical protein
MVRRALFPGSNNEDELMLIFKTLGTPTPETWPGMEKFSGYDPTFPRYTAKVRNRYLANECR